MPSVHAAPSHVPACLLLKQMLLSASLSQMAGAASGPGLSFREVPGETEVGLD